MKHIKLYEELKINENQYHTYDLLNLIRQKDLNQKGQNEMINMIKSGQIDLDLPNQLNGKPALHFAIINRYENVFDELIKSGANLDIQDENGTTALILSSMGLTGSSINYFVSIIQKLIKAGSDWNIKQNYGNNIIRDFIYYLNKNEEIKKFILKKYPNQYEIYLTKKNSDKFNI